MHTLITILVWSAALVGALVVLALVVVLVEAAAGGVSRWRRNRRVVQAQVPTQPEARRLALLVDVDEGAGLLRPSVQISGPPPVRGASVRVELVDARGAVRLVVGRSISPRAIGSEVPLPAFVPPPGMSVHKVLGWRWDVVLQDAEGELGRWRERPSPVGAVNAEGEVDMPVQDGPESPADHSRSSMQEDMAAFVDAFARFGEIPRRLADGTWGL